MEHKDKHTTQQKIITLLCEKETINQVDIAKEIKTSLPTVITNVNELVKNGLLEIAGVGDSRGGRKPVVVNINANSKFTFGIDFLVDTVKIIMFNFKMRTVATEEFATSRFINFDDIMDKVILMIKDMLLTNNITISNLLGIGISIPGIVNEHSKNIEVAPNLHIANTQLKKYAKLFNLPVFFENEANAAAYAEWQTGAAKGCTNVLYLSIMKGVGAGIIMNKRLYRGSCFKAGEVGHIIIRRGGRKCTCGENGCLNGYISIDSILKEYEERSNKKISSLSEFISLKKNSDQNAIEIWNEYAEDFAFALKSLLITIDPEITVIGGEIARYSSELIPAITKELNASKSNVFNKNNKIITSELMENASITGVALYLRNKYINNY